jgi:glycosyltransferase involved in cell wall biosynthesis
MKLLADLERPSADNAPRAPEAAPGRVHVLFMVDELMEMGGAERVLLSMIRSLPRERFDCSLVTFRIDPHLATFGQFPCRLHVIPIRRTYGLSAMRVAWRLRGLIRKEKVQIVHTFFETSDLWGGVLARLSGVPVLISSRRDLGILRRRKHAWAYRFVNPFFSAVLAVSEQVRRYCIERDGIPPGRVITLYNGVPLQAAPERNDLPGRRKALGFNGFCHIVLTVGHIRRVKGVDVFLRAAEEVCRARPETLFLVVGDDDEPEHFEELQRLVKELGVAGNVLFYGPSERVPALIAASDVFCLPSRSEGFSNALIEAMGAGLPCIATRVGGNAEAIEDERNGYLVPSEDPPAMARRVLDLLSDPLRAAELGRNAAETVRARFTHEAMMSQLVDIYERLLAAAAR